MNEEKEIREELSDQLLDLVLREKIRGESPPDLTARIVEADTTRTIERVEKSSKGSTSAIAWLVGLAAVIVGALLIFPNKPSNWFASAKKVEMSASSVPSNRHADSELRENTDSTNLGFLTADDDTDHRFGDSADMSSEIAPEPVTDTDGLSVAEEFLGKDEFGEDKPGPTASPNDVDFYFRGYGDVPHAAPRPTTESYSVVEPDSEAREESYMVLPATSESKRKSYTVVPSERSEGAEPPLVYPEEDEFESLVERRSKYASVDLSDPSMELEADDGVKLDVEFSQESLRSSGQYGAEDGRDKSIAEKQINQIRRRMFDLDPEYFDLAESRNALSEKAQIELKNLMKALGTFDSAPSQTSQAEFDQKIRQLAAEISQLEATNAAVDLVRKRKESLAKLQAWRREQELRISELINAAIAKANENPRGDKYEPIQENPFLKATGQQAVSTFSIDVDTASYSNVRQFLNSGSMPPPNAVRLEELINYFDYQYQGPAEDSEHPFASHVEVANCPWNSDHRLVRIGIKGRTVETEERPKTNLVFLVDVSGSMDEPNKLPLVVDGLRHMTYELGENDRVAIVVYASAEGLALPSTRGDKQTEILESLSRLSAGGSTAGGAGIELAYKIAQENFIPGGVNRVILCTDGDFNVGTTSTIELQRLAERKAAESNTFLTVLGFGRGNLNDEMMETISNKGNGNYFYIDNLREARRVLVNEMNSTITTIAKDVKIQVEFNPANVAAYRLLGYENRKMAREDFDDDTKDAGEIGAGHTVTALYEVVPAGLKIKPDSDGSLKYQPVKEDVKVADDSGLMPAKEFSDELLTLRLRYKPPTGDKSTKIEVAVKNESQEFASASEDLRFASSVVGFGMLLRGSQYSGNASFESVREMASTALGEDNHGYRAEFIELVDKARQLKE